MSFWVLTQEGCVLSRRTVQRVTNLELETAENRARTSSIQLNAADYFIQDGDEHITPGERGDSSDFDPAFQEEFNKVITDELLPEADKEFTPEVYEARQPLTLTWKSQYQGVVARLSSRKSPSGFSTRTMGCQLGLPMTTRS